MLELAIALLFGAVAAVAPAALLFPALLVAARIARDRRIAVPLVLLAIAAVQAARAESALREREERRARFLSNHAGVDRCNGWAEIRGAPTLRGDRFTAEAHLLASRCERGPPLDANVSLSFMPPLARGDRILGAFDVGARTEFANGLLLERALPAARRRVVASATAIVIDETTRASPFRVSTLVDRARNAVRARLMQRFSTAAHPLARALVLGETDLPPDVDTAFKQSGLAHLLAVSGMHLVVVCGVLAWLVAAVVRRIPAVVRRVPATRVAAIAVAPLALLYTDFTGASGSAVRAAWMASFVTLASFLGRRPNVARSLILATAGMSALDPLALFDVSFALSLAATSALVAWELRARLEIQLPPHRSTAWGAIRRVVGASARASLACAPILALLDAESSLAGPLFNVVAIPLGEIYALPLCLLTAILPDAPVITEPLVLLTEGSLRALAWLATQGAHVLRVTLPYPRDFELGVLMSASFVFFGARVRGEGTRRVWLALAIACIVADEGVTRARRIRSTALSVTHLDVGQGDAALLELPHGGVILVDAGGLVANPIDVGRAVIRPALRSRRIDHIDVIVLSHPHPDHYGGLAIGVRDVSIDEVWDSGLSRETTGPASAWILDVEARGAHVRSARALCDAPRGSLDRSGVSLRVLAPCPSFDPARSVNDNSLVVRASLGGTSFLFAGDAERAEESEALASGAVETATVLKVGHHGSKTSSSPEWLARVAPQVAVVSAGARNRFGHPAPVTLRALERASILVFRTDHHGAVTLTTNGGVLRVETARAISDEEARVALPWDRTPEHARGRDPPPRSQSASESGW